MHEKHTLAHIFYFGSKKLFINSLPLCLLVEEYIPSEFHIIDSRDSTGATHLHHAETSVSLSGFGKVSSPDRLARSHKVNSTALHPMLHEISSLGTPGTASNMLRLAGPQQTARPPRPPLSMK